MPVYEWIEHGGGECPVDGGVPVRIKPRNGIEDSGWAMDYEWRWSNFKPQEIGLQITHYSVIAQKPQGKNNGCLEDKIEAALLALIESGARPSILVGRERTEIAHAIALALG